MASVIRIHGIKYVAKKAKKTVNKKKTYRNINKMKYENCKSMTKLTVSWWVSRLKQKIFELDFIKEFARSYSSTCRYIIYGKKIYLFSYFYYFSKRKTAVYQSDIIMADWRTRKFYMLAIEHIITNICTRTVATVVLGCFPPFPCRLR